MPYDLDLSQLDAAARERLLAEWERLFVQADEVDRAGAICGYGDTVFIERFLKITRTAFPAAVRELRRLDEFLRQVAEMSPTIREVDERDAAVAEAARQ